METQETVVHMKEWEAYKSLKLKFLLIWLFSVPAFLAAREHLLLIKTTARRLKSLEREVLRLHSYETPEFLVLPISSGSRAYLKWLYQSVKEIV